MKMRRDLSTTSVALLALGLAVASAVFCWRWSVRYAATVDKNARETLSIGLRHDQLEQIVYGMWTAMCRETEGTSTPLPAGTPSGRQISRPPDLGSSPTLTAVEADLAEAFFADYLYKQHTAKAAR